LLDKRYLIIGFLLEFWGEPGVCKVDIFLEVSRKTLVILDVNFFVYYISQAQSVRSQHGQSSCELCQTVSLLLGEHLSTHTLSVQNWEQGLWHVNAALEGYAQFEKCHAQNLDSSFISALKIRG
jgi:hypothetical protein